MIGQQEEMLALAEACRKLASRCENRDPPPMGTHRLFTDDGTPCCATGWAWHMAGFSAEGVWQRDRKSPGEEARIEMRDATDALYSANNRATDEERPQAVIEPLRRVAVLLDKWAPAFAPAPAPKEGA